MQYNELEKEKEKEEKKDSKETKDTKDTKDVKEKDKDKRKEKKDRENRLTVAVPTTDNAVNERGMFLYEVCEKSIMVRHCYPITILL